MRCPEARSAKINRPDGVSRRFQVSVNKVEPSKSVTTCNLLAKDRDRLSLSDEAKPRWPKMAGIGGAIGFPRRAEGLAGAGACPDRPLVEPSDEPERITPDSDAREEMALGISGKVFCSYFLDVSLINVSGRDVARRDQVA
jgi:hypothetical protein